MHERWKNLPSIRRRTCDHEFGPLFSSSVFGLWRLAQEAKQKNMVENQIKLKPFFFSLLILFANQNYVNAIRSCNKCNRTCAVCDAAKWKQIHRYLFCISHKPAAPIRWGIEMSKQTCTAHRVAITPYEWEAACMFSLCFFVRKIEIEKSFRFCFLLNS